MPGEAHVLHTDDLLLAVSSHRGSGQRVLGVSFIRGTNVTHEDSTFTI